MVRIDDAQARYVEIAKATFPRQLSLTGLRIVIDCANGAAYKVAPDRALRAGRRGDPGRRHAQRLQHQRGVRLDPSGQPWPRRCKEYRADIGIALDGDADRLVICDEKGQIVDGDQIMALIAAAWADAGPAAAAAAWWPR